MVNVLVKDINSFFVPSRGFISPILTILCVLASLSQTSGQNNVFSAQIITDVNFSQIRGDLLAGYHRIGYGAGIGVSYRLAPQWNAHVELMYRNAGSRNSPYTPVKRSINIHLAQIPIYASYLTWWDNGLSRIHFDIGMIYGRIINSSIRFPQFEDNAIFIKDNDFSIMAGMGFWFNRHHGLKARYIRSVSVLMENKAEDLKWQLYYISLQYHYRF